MHQLHSEQGLAVNLTNFYWVTAHQILLNMIQELRTVNTSLSWFPWQFWRENCFPNHLSLAEASGSYRCPAHFGTSPSHSTPEPHTSTSHSCQRQQKAPKYCWATAASDVAQYQTISGKATRVLKHCLKKRQFPSLTHSSACFQTQRSSVSSSRDQFETQILLIRNYVILLCEHLPFYLQ